MSCNEKVTITRNECLNLTLSSEKLSMLEADGVDNWDNIEERITKEHMEGDII